MGTDLPFIFYFKMEKDNLTVRRAQNLTDYQSCVEIQKEVWSLTGSDDQSSTMASLALLKIANEHGGCVLVAEDPSQRLVGFSFALLGKGVWWSHMTAVLPEYRNRNVGLALKLRQREECLGEGIHEIQWTFDPLQAANAHFNFQKLGVIVRRYEENVYGSTTSVLHHGLPTDRFIAEWRLESDRVKDRIGEGKAIILRDLDGIVPINISETNARLDLTDEYLLLEIPSDIRRVHEPAEWQMMLRQVCSHYFSAGYSVTDFFRLTTDRPHALYLLSRTSALL
jgi:predicted GNAT superfamily acetyltransferase